MFDRLVNMVHGFTVSIIEIPSQICTELFPNVYPVGKL